MRLLARKPLLLACLLTLPLWVVLRNIVVALSVSLLLAFLISMIDALLVLGRSHAAKKPAQKPRPHEKR